MGTIGRISEFNQNNDWNLWLKRIESYIKANQVPNELKVATLLSLIGPGSYKMIRDLCYPIKPQEKTFAELCVIMNNQFAYYASTWRERIKFYNARQKESEPFSEYYARLKSLSGMQKESESKEVGEVKAILDQKGHYSGYKPKWRASTASSSNGAKHKQYEDKNGNFRNNNYCQCCGKKHR